MKSLSRKPGEPTVGQTLALIRELEEETANRTAYDAEADTLYVRQANSTGDLGVRYIEDEHDLIWRTTAEATIVYGLTILDFSVTWLHQLDRLAEICNGRAPASLYGEVFWAWAFREARHAVRNHASSAANC